MKELFPAAFQIALEESTCESYPTIEIREGDKVPGAFLAEEVSRCNFHEKFPREGFMRKLYVEVPDVNSR